MTLLVLAERGSSGSPVVSWSVLAQKPRSVSKKYGSDLFFLVVLFFTGPDRFGRDRYLGDY